MSADQNLAGRRVFVIEDEATVSMLIEDALVDMGCEVVDTASRLPEAMKKAAAVACDVAVIDVNLNGQMTFQVADALVTRGIPFVFSTGYGKSVIPNHFLHAPVLQKPFQQHDLESALRAALAARA